LAVVSGQLRGVCTGRQTQSCLADQTTIIEKQSQFPPCHSGVNSAKDVIRGRLHLEPPKPGAAAAGYMHFPDDRDLGYFNQLLAERLVYKVISGQRYSIWEAIPGRANEALDCLVYSYAALCGLKHMGLKLNVRAANLEADPDKFLPAPVGQKKKSITSCRVRLLKNQRRSNVSEYRNSCRNKENHVQPEHQPAGWQ
jgi:phage terminase large subunit GpA-like protein